MLLYSLFLPSSFLHYRIGQKNVNKLKAKNRNKPLSTRNAMNSPGVSGGRQSGNTYKE